MNHPPPSAVVTSLLPRLELYLSRVRRRLASGQLADRFDALADIAEVGEPARRLYRQLERENRFRSPPEGGTL